jgi:hypothetical protein
MKNIISAKIKKFDVIPLLFENKTVDYIQLRKNTNWCNIVFMDKTNIFTLSNELVEVKRDNFYCVTHIQYLT